MFHCKAVLHVLILIKTAQKSKLSIIMEYALSLNALNKGVVQYIVKVAK